MNFLERLLIESQARKDAERRIDASEDGMLARRGARPVFDPVNNYDDKQVAMALNNRSELEELREDERRQEDALARHRSVVVLFIGLAGTFIAEATGNVLLLRSLGVQGSARWLGAVGLNMGLILFTQTLSTEGDTENTPKVGRKVIVRFIYIALIVAIALARIGGLTAAEDEGIVMMGVELIVMVALVAFPSFLGDRFLRQLAPALRARRELEITRRRIKRAERAHREADRRLRKLGREQREWDREKAQHLAVYGSAHRRARKEGEEK
ncbi:MAG: hypothetical protein U0326_06415 [Polyangiales bacterium]